MKNKQQTTISSFFSVSNEKKIKKETKPETKRIMKYKNAYGNTWVDYMELLPEEVRMDKKFFETAWSSHPTEKGRVVIMGKEINTPRYQQPFGRNYTYTGMNHKALPLSHFPGDFLEKLLRWARQQYDGKWNWNGVLVNWYEDPSENYIGPHSDDERELVPNSPILSFTYGCMRDFKLHAKEKSAEGSTPEMTIALPNNSLIVMGGTCQKTHKHSVPKRKRCIAHKKSWDSCASCEKRRINITLRCFA